MNTYTKTDSVDQIIEELIENDTDHYHLQNAGVTVAVLFFSGDNSMMHGGYQAAATIRKTNPKERALGQEDAVLTIDYAHWKELNSAQRMALVDHELMHLAPVIDGWIYERDQEGNLVYLDGRMVRRSCTYKTDEHGRPKLRMRLHDVQHGWFVRNAEKWGADSGEKQQAAALSDRYGQLLFGVIATETERQLSIRRESLRLNELPSGTGETVGDPKAAEPVALAAA